MAARPAAERRQDLIALYRQLSPEWRCPLRPTRTTVVFGTGNADADLMFVGEAPGATEDQQGKPFVGRAGKLLDTLLGEIGLERAHVFIANVLKCRPPGNRDPLPEEIEECSPWLFRQIELIRPKVICTLGNFSTKLLTGSPVGITKVHGRPQTRELGDLRVELFPIFHPAAALRSEAMLTTLRGDFARLPALLEEARAEVGPAPELAPDLPKHEGSEAGRGETAGAAGPAAGATSAGSGDPDDQLDLFA